MGQEVGAGGPCSVPPGPGDGPPWVPDPLGGEMGRKKRKMWGGWGPGMNEKERQRKEQRHDSGPQREENRWRHRKPTSASRTDRKT